VEAFRKTLRRVALAGWLWAFALLLGAVLLALYLA
jgi:hypothetical protein